MLENNTIIKVTNRSAGSVGYNIPDLNNLHRNYTSGETKEVTMEELRKLSYIDGGMTLIKEYLVIDNQEAINELLNQGVEPEYFYTKDKVKDLLLNGSLDELKDCLDFAPKGTVDLVKQVAIDLEIPDVYKREAIQEITGLNINKAIEINKMTSEDEEDQGPMVRRINNKEPEKEEKPAQRRTAILDDNKYNIVK